MKKVNLVQHVSGVTEEEVDSMLLYRIKAASDFISVMRAIILILDALYIITRLTIQRDRK